QATFREHRATAERVLRDYARLAAARFAQRTAQNLYYMACWPVVEAFTRSGAGTRPDHLPTPAALAAGLDSVPAAFVRHARDAFRLYLRSGQLVTAGAAPSAAVRRWLKDTLPLHLEAVYMKEEHVAALVVSVTLLPAIAEKLVIGGLQRSRLPFVLGVLLLTAGLIVTALVQLRREYDLARLRTDFVSGVSHELRTPLAQIRMFGGT